MPLVSGYEVLERAKKEGYAVGAFNANNLEMLQAIVEACAEEKSPVFLQISQGAIRYIGLEASVYLVKNAAENSPIPIVLHLDHGTSFEQNIRCLKAGFTSLMFDGSKFPREKNIEITKKITEVAHTVGVPVEAELGRIGGVEENLTPAEVETLKTKPEEAKMFIEETKCDSLAIAIGSVHRMRVSSAELDISLLQKIKKEVDIPLVLHAASGVSLISMKEAIKEGICKVNVATRLSIAFLEGIKEGLEKMPEESDFRKIFLPAKDKIKEVVKEYLEIFGCKNKI